MQEIEVKNDFDAKIFINGVPIIDSSLPTRNPAF